MKKLRAVFVIMLMIISSMMCACFPKGYTEKEEKDQLAHAIAIARVYQEKYAPSARLKEDTFRVYDSLAEGDHKLYLTDWVSGECLDDGVYSIYINTVSDELYSDRGWTNVQIYGQELVCSLCGLDEGQTTVDVWGSTELPFCRDDASFGMLTLTNMIPVTDTVTTDYVRDLLLDDRYSFTYRIDVNESVDTDMFRKLDTAPLGKNVSISVRKYSDDAFTDRKNHPEKRSVGNREGLLDEYYSDMPDGGE